MTRAVGETSVARYESAAPITRSRKLMNMGPITRSTSEALNKASVTTTGTSIITRKRKSPEDKKKTNSAAAKKRKYSEDKMKTTTAAAEKRKSPEDKKKTTTATAEKRKAGGETTTEKPEIVEEVVILRKGNTVRSRSGFEWHFDGTQEEYDAFEDALDEFLSNPPIDPELDRVQSETMCRNYFQFICEKMPEMADYELVEPMAVRLIIEWCWVHLNFKAKHKDEEDESAAIYFAELDMTKSEVNYITKLNMDPSTDDTLFKVCGYCHPREGLSFVSDGGCVYHPVDGGFTLGAL